MVVVVVVVVVVLGGISSGSGGVKGLTTLPCHKEKAHRTAYHQSTNHHEQSSCLA